MSNDMIYKTSCLDVPVGTIMSEASEAQRLAGNLYTKIREVHDLTKVFQGKIDDDAHRQDVPHAPHVHPRDADDAL